MKEIMLASEFCLLGFTETSRLDDLCMWESMGVAGNL